MYLFENKVLKFMGLYKRGIRSLNGESEDYIRISLAAQALMNNGTFHQQRLGGKTIRYFGKLGIKYSYIFLQVK